MDSLSNALHGALERALTGDGPQLALDDLLGKSRADIEDAVRTALQDPGLLDVLTTPGLMSQLLFDMAAKGDYDSCLGAIQRGADVHRLNGAGESALHVATRSHSVPCANLLLRAGAQVNIFAPGLGTAMHVAAAAGDEAMTLLLLDAGSDPHERDPSGSTAVELMRADHLEQYRVFAHYAEQHDERKQAAARLAAYIAGTLPSVSTGSPLFRAERHARLYRYRPWSEEAHRCATPSIRVCLLDSVALAEHVSHCFKCLCACSDMPPGR
jgi:hypothetical protein